jgi:hypothetical protein
MEARENTMAALKKAADATAGSGSQPPASSPRIEMATQTSTPVESGAQQLRLHLEAALAGSQSGVSFAEPGIEKWPGPVRAAILAGAVVFPWSLVALIAHAIVRYRLFPSIY